MKQILKLVFLLVIGQTAFAQAPSNYTNINGRYRWIAGMFDSTFHIPKGTTPSLRTGGSTNAGALFYKTGDSSLYIYTGTQWLKIAGAAGFVPYSGATQNVNLGIYDILAKSATIADTGGTAATILQRTSINTDVALYAKAVGNRGFAAIIEQADSNATGTQYQTIFRKSMMPGTGNPAPGAGVSWYTQISNDNNNNPAVSVYRARIIDSTGYASGLIRQTSTEFWTRKNNVWDTTLVLNGGNVGINTGQDGIDSALTVANGTWLKRGVRMSALPTGVGTKSVRIDANGNLSTTDTTATTGYVPYTGATQDLDMGTFSVNAKSFHIKGTAGQGHLGLKHQTATPTISSNESGVYADVNGDLGLKNDNLYTSIFKTSLNSADRTYTFQNKSYTVGDSSDIAARVKYTDTASMLSPYLRSNVAAATYVPQTRTITINGTSQDLSANRTYNVGTVTSVATSTGTGITGGTITSSGTIAADTLLLSTRAWRQKGIDSVAALANTKISGTGTTNYIPKFTSSSAIGNSQLFENGSKFTYDNSLGQIEFVNTTAANTLSSYTTGAASYNDFITRAATHQWLIGGSEQMRLTSTGLGIGTSSPLTKLQINGTNPVFTLYADNGGTDSKIVYLQNVAGDLNFAKANDAYNTFTSLMRLTNSGNLGIGTSSPAVKLEVNGQIAVNTSNNSSNVYLQNSGTTYLQLRGNTTNAFINNPTNGAIAFGTNDLTRMLLDASGNLGLGVTPSAWGSTFKSFDESAGNLASFSTSELYLTQGGYNNSGWKYTATGFASQYLQVNGQHRWNIAPSGTAGNAISFTQAMTLDASGNLGIGLTSSFRGKIDVGGLAVVGNGTSGVSTEGIRFSRSGDDFRYQSIFTTSGGSAAANLMQFNLHNNSTATSQTTVMTLNGAGNVGIGTSSPTQKLDVVISSGPYNTRFHNSSTSTSDYNAILVSQGASGSATGYFGTGGSAAGNTSFANTFVIGTQSNSAFVFNTNDTERMRITSGGNVGIGTTSPDGTLVLSAGTAGTASTGGYIGLTTGTNSSKVRGAGIEAFTTDTGNDHGLRFYTNAAASSPSERMRITSGGELLINTTSDAGDYKLQVNGNGYFNSTSSVPFLINTNTDNITTIRTSNAAGDAFVGFENSGDANNAFAIGRNNAGDFIINHSASSVYGGGTLTNYLKITSTGNAEFAGSIKTAAPSGGTAKTYKLGEAGVAIGGSDGYAVKVEIDGTLYYLMTGYLPEPAPEATSGPSIGYKAKFEEPVIKIKTESQEIKELKKQIEELKQLIKNK